MTSREGILPIGTWGTFVSLRPLPLGHWLFRGAVESERAGPNTYTTSRKVAAGSIGQATFLPARLPACLSQEGPGRY